MEVLSLAGFWFALISIVSACILMVHARSPSSESLQERMADRVRQSIEVLDTCAQPLTAARSLTTRHRRRPLGVLQAPAAPTHSATADW